MSYIETQREKAVKQRDNLFRDPGSGIFMGKPREFVLNDPSLNLWDGIHHDAKQYFKKYDIQWWKGESGDPTGHLLSSQVACLNHLYYVRQRKDIATALLQKVMPEIVEAIMVEDGFVEFEYIGTKQYLKERGFTRGANCTSIDAAMLGVTSHNERVLFLIEWKYTEIYKKEDKYIPERAKVYDALIKNPDGPFKEGIEPKSLYYEPFYQMMRQTLLGWYFVRNKELGCSKCINLHVIPEDNLELKETITSPGLSGKNIHQAWKKILKWPELYVSIDPSEFIKAAEKLNDSQSWIAYLRNRYW